MKSKWFAALASAALLMCSGLAAAQSSSMTCTCGGQSYRGSCPAGQTAVSCDCKSITLICQKATPTAKAAANTKGAQPKAQAKAAKPAQKATAKAAPKPAKKPPAKAVKPVAKPAVKPAVKPTAKPVAKPAAKPAAKPGL